MLTEKTRTTKVTAEYVSGDFLYSVVYEWTDERLVSLRCTIFKSGEYVGAMSTDENGSNTLTFKEGELTTSHVSIYEKLSKEIVGKIVEEAKKSSSES